MDKEGKNLDEISLAEEPDKSSGNGVRESIAQNIRPPVKKALGSGSGKSTMSAGEAPRGMCESLIKSAKENERKGISEEAYVLYTYASKMSEGIANRELCIKMIQLHREHGKFGEAHMIFIRSIHILEKDKDAIHELYLTFLAEAGGDKAKAESAFSDFARSNGLDNEVIDDYFKHEKDTHGNSLADSIKRMLGG
jgi:hypothetical protein